MKLVKIFVILLIWLAFGFVGYLIYKQIKTPYATIQKMEKRKAAIIDRLIDLRTLQKAFNESYGHYTANKDSLISNYKYGTFEKIKTIGDPYDTTSVVTYDTLNVSFKEENRYELKSNNPLDSLFEIPYTDNQFTLDAGRIEVQRVNIAVFEIKAPEEDYLGDLEDLKGLASKEDFGLLKVGSMTQGTDAGNWQ